MKTCPDCDKPYKGISCSCGYQERVGASTATNYTYNPPKVYERDHSPLAKELAKDSIDFMKTILSWRGSTKEKILYKIDYLKIMANKYTSIYDECHSQIREAKRELNEILASENTTNQPSGNPQSEK